MVDPCISLRPKFSLLQFLIPFWLHFKATLISTWNENTANKNPFFRPSKVNDSWKKQVFGETHYWNLEWIKEEITLSNGYIVIHRISVIKTYWAVQVKEPIYPVNSVIYPSSDRGQKAHLR